MAIKPNKFIIYYFRCVDAMDTHTQAKNVVSNFTELLNYNF